MLNLYIMSDFETSIMPDKKDGVYAWLTGYKVCGLLDYDTTEKKFYGWKDNELNELPIDKEFHYFYGKNALKEWLESIFEIAKICKKYNINCHVFFHNARYDFSYIQFHTLFKCGKYNNKSKEYYMTKVVIDENNTFYSCCLNLKKRTNKKDFTSTIIIRDLYKILPSKLADIGDSVGLPKGKDFDYDMVRPYDYIPTDYEINEYFFKDIEIMCKAYKRLPEFFYGKYTIGSIVKNYYLNKHLPQVFPNMPKEFVTENIFPTKGDVIEYSYKNNELIPFGHVPLYNIMKKVMYGYKGGMTICNKDYLGKTLYNDKLPYQLVPVNDKQTIKIYNDIFHLDVNSLYPSVMHHNEYPIGIPKIVHNNYEYDDTKNFEQYLINEMKENNKRIIIEVNIKRGKVKKNKAPLFLKKDLNRDLYNIKIDNAITNNNSYKAFYETFEFNMENITLEEFLLLKENYDLIYEIKYAIIFNSSNKLFTSFVDELVALKIKYDDDEFLRLCYKLCLNNLYGKFGEQNEKTTLFKDVDNDGNWFTKETKTKFGKYFYPPIAVYVTSYARMTMIKYINIVGWKNVLYMDTDSIHLMDTNAYKRLEKTNCINKTELGKLKLEDICFGERVLSPKKYCYYGKILKKDKEMFKVKCAGLPDKAQKEIKSFEQFNYGLTFVPKDLYTVLLYILKNAKEKGIINEYYSNIIPIGKLAQSNVFGGMYLKPCLFQIRIPDYIKLKYNIDDLENDKLNTYII